MRQQTSDNLKRIVPANIQAEQMLLGAILINCDSLNQVNEFLRAEHFFEVLHQKIYRAIETLVEKDITASTVTLKSMLNKDHLFDEAGGINYLAKLTAMAMVIINCHDYGKIIYDLAVKRNLIKLGEDIVNDAYSSTLEVSGSEQLEQAEAKLFHLASEGLNENCFVHIKYPINQSIESINRAMKSPDHVVGIPSGLFDLDTKLSGFHNSDLIILAGRPSMGKTAFAVNFALNACQALIKRKNSEDQVPAVGVFSLEMSSEQIATRILSMMTHIDSSSLRNGKVKEEQYNSLKQAAIKMADIPLFVDDTPAMSIGAIRTRARKLKRKHNLAILFIDYLQLIRSTRKSENRVLEVSEITQGLKALAKELNIPIIALSQLSRAVEKREDKRPLLSDLRESGSIEQDADVVMFVYREGYYLGAKEPTPGTEEYEKWQKRMDEVRNLAEIIVTKHRNGAIGTVKVHYDSMYSTVSNYG